jgi:hypothetical protein
MSYDSIKAKAYGADDYGMKKYVIAFLKSRPNRTLDKDSANALQWAHTTNIGKMAEALTNRDPAIIAGSLVMELKEWYGSAALMAINKLHGSIAKTEF